MTRPVALITGVGPGTGAALARRFSDGGYAVAMLARNRGVTITLRSPCEYCVPATTGMITNKGLSATHELTEDQNGNGCVWTTSRNVSRPADGHRAVSEG